jgi:deoxycytidylate deaminase
MFISSIKIEGAYNNGDSKTKVYGPCMICKKEIINAGLIEVYMREEGVGKQTYSIEDLKEQLRSEEEDWRKKFKGVKPEP